MCYPSCPGWQGYHGSIQDRLRQNSQLPCPFGLETVQEQIHTARWPWSYCNCASEVAGYASLRSSKFVYIPNGNKYWVDNRWKGRRVWEGEDQEHEHLDMHTRETSSAHWIDIWFWNWKPPNAGFGWSRCDAPDGFSVNYQQYLIELA